jgi:hypothetical protein
MRARQATATVRLCRRLWLVVDSVHRTARGLPESCEPGRHGKPVESLFQRDRLGARAVVNQRHGRPS